METLKQKTARGLFWGGMNTMVQQVIGLLFGIILGRLLAPSDYGMMAIISVFSLVAVALQDSGFKVALANEKAPTHADYNAVFWFNILMGIAGHTMLIRRDFLQRPDTWSGDRIVYDWSIAINAWFFRPPHAIVRVDEPLNWHRSHDGEAALLQNIAVCGRQRKATWQPYAYGLRNYRALQRKPAWQMLYTHIAQATAGRPDLALPHRMASLMLRPGLPALLRLCLRHRGAIRGFFYPFIFAWHCSQFDME